MCGSFGAHIRPCGRRFQLQPSAEPAEQSRRLHQGCEAFQAGNADADQRHHHPHQQLCHSGQHQGETPCHRQPRRSRRPHSVLLQRPWRTVGAVRLRRPVALYRTARHSRFERCRREDSLHDVCHAGSIADAATTGDGSRNSRTQRGDWSTRAMRQAGTAFL